MILLQIYDWVDSEQIVIISRLAKNAVYYKVQCLEFFKPTVQLIIHHACCLCSLFQEKQDEFSEKEKATLDDSAFEELEKEFEDVRCIRLGLLIKVAKPRCFFVV